MSTADQVLAEGAVRTLRRATLGRSLRANVRWIVRAVGWGSIVYLAFWSVVLVLAALQSITPLPAPLVQASMRWAVPASSIALALALLLAARTQVSPVWLDRRDLTHLAPGAARPVVVLAWPVARVALQALTVGLMLGGAVTLIAPRLLGHAAPAALLVVPTVTLALPLLRWRAALAGGRDSVAWSLALLSLAAAALATGCTVAGATHCALVAGAPGAAAIGAVPPSAGLAVAGALAGLAVTLAYGTVRSAAGTIPPLLLRQSELLAELRAIATLRGLAALSAAPPDPGARFAEARARAALRGRRAAFTPAWRPPVPRRGGAVAAFAWLAFVRAWRSSAVTLASLPVLVTGVALVVAVGGPFGGAALVPSLALAWAAAVLHPGRVGWPGFAVDGRARTLAHLLLVGGLALVGTALADAANTVLARPPATEGWLLVPLGLAAAALVDAIGARAADPRAADVWILAGVLATVPAALLGWFGVEPGVAAPLAAAAWLLVVWLRVLASQRHA